MEFTLAYKLLAVGWAVCLLWVPYVIASNRRTHPGALFLLFFVELWERFSYYGMRGLLTLYMIDKTAELKYEEATAYGVYAAYGSMVYATPILGGLIAEKLLGYRRAIFWGGLLMAIGHFLMAGPAVLPESLASASFFVALAFLILGNGFFKPNISSCVGELYAPGDERRDRGFNLFYMGINVGAFLAPITCGAIGQDENLGWHWGFSLAGIGMTLGLVLFVIGQNSGWLKQAGLPPRAFRESRIHYLVYGVTFLFVPLVFVLLRWGASPLIELAMGGGVKLSTLDMVLFTLCFGMMGYLLLLSTFEDKVQREQLFVVVILFMFSTLFWTFFELAGSAINVFTEKNVDRTIGWLDSEPLSASQFQGVNPLLIVFLAPFYNFMWWWLRKKNLEPNVAIKFSLGVLLLGLGFFVFPMGATFAQEGMVPMAFVLLAYLLHTLGELCLSPVGLSLVTRLSPPKIVGFVMGFWFLSSSLAHLLGKFIAQETASDKLTPVEALDKYSSVFWTVGLYAVIASVVLLVLSPLITKWMHEGPSKPPLSE